MSEEMVEDWHGKITRSGPTKTYVISEGSTSLTPMSRVHGLTGLLSDYYQDMAKLRRDLSTLKLVVLIQSLALVAVIATVWLK